MRTESALFLYYLLGPLQIDFRMRLPLLQYQFFPGENQLSNLLGSELVSTN